MRSADKIIDTESILKFIIQLKRFNHYKNLVFLSFRYLNNRMISYDPAFHVEPLLSSNMGGLQWPIGTILSVSQTNFVQHDGNYTCAPSTLTSDSILAHIIDEGKIPPAAVYGDSSKCKQTADFCYDPVLMMFLAFSVTFR